MVVLLAIIFVFLIFLIFLLYFLKNPPTRKVTQEVTPTPVASPGVLAEAASGVQPNAPGTGNSPSPEATASASPTSVSSQQTSAETASLPQSPGGAGYNPVFSMSVTDSSAGAASEVLLTVTNPRGSKKTVTQIYSIPAGWQVASSQALAEGLQIGEGDFGVTLPVLGTLSVPFTLKSSQVNLGAHKLQIVVDFPGPLPFNVSLFMDGDNGTGHTIRIDRPANANANIGPPTVLNVRWFSNVLANPIDKGSKAWTAEFRSINGEIVTRNSQVTIK